MRYSPKRMCPDWLFFFSSRRGFRVHYSSQTAAPSRGFPDFVLRAPAAAGADRPSSSSVSDEEEEGEVAPAIQQAPPTHPLPPDSRDDNARLREGAAAPPGGCCFLGVGGVQNGVSRVPCLQLFFSSSAPDSRKEGDDGPNGVQVR